MSEFERIRALREKNEIETEAVMKARTDDLMIRNSKIRDTTQFDGFMSRLAETSRARMAEISQAHAKERAAVIINSKTSEIDEK